MINQACLGGSLITYAIKKLGREFVAPNTSIYSAGSILAKHKNIRQFIFRNDTEKWNAEPSKYPDGVYWGIDYRDERLKWKIDIWFVEDEKRQPDLKHLSEFLPRLTKQNRESIINIKREWMNRPEYGNEVTSYYIYTAVLDNGVRTVEDFRNFITKALERKS